MINLLPPKDRMNLEFAKRNTVLRRYLELCLLATVFLAFLMVGSYYYLNQQKKNTQAELEFNQQKVAELEPVQEEAEELSKTINTISAIFASDVKFSSMLTDIGALTPSGTVLSGLELSGVDAKSPLVISAQVETENKAAVLRNNLAASDLFDDAKILSINRIGLEDSTDQASEEDAPADSPYKFVVTIEAYFATGDAS